MSCNYADGLSPYEDKGVKFDTIDKLKKKCELLAQLLESSQHVVVHTGAGISTAAGIPDFRGPNGVWTLEREGRKPTTDISFAEATPTKTHMALKKLVETNKVHYIISQNIDGLHLKSGLPRKYLAELHGNMFVDECNLCKRQFVRSRPVESVGKKLSAAGCLSGRAGGRPCRGRLADAVLDWEHSLPDSDLSMADCHSSIADLSICLGTTLQIIPSGNLPLETAKYGGKLVICNLQPTKHDNKADLVINYYVDDILERVMDILGIEIPSYNSADDPTKLANDTIIDWSICKKDVLATEKIYKVKCKGVKKKRILIKTKRPSDETAEKDVKTKVLKTEIKQGSVVEKLNGVTKDEHAIKAEIKNESLVEKSNGVLGVTNNEQSNFENRVSNHVPKHVTKEENDDIIEIENDEVLDMKTILQSTFTNREKLTEQNKGYSVSNGIIVLD